MRKDILTLQNLINSGMAWRLEGRVGREAMRALEAGDCMLGTERQRDYYGNMVPSRYDVAPGSKGSRQLVVSENGESHASELELVPNEFMVENFISNLEEV